MKPVVAFGTLVASLVVSLPCFAAEPQDQRMREAYRMILAQADANKDGKLSAAECRSIWKDKGTAEQNCSFWDVDKDGFITEAEYVKQASSFRGKR